MLNLNQETIINILIVIKNIVLGMAGGIVNYLYLYTKAKKEENVFVFSMVELFVNSILGGFVGYSISTVIPSTITGYEGLIALSGAVSFKIIEMSEIWFVRVIEKRLEIDKLDKLDKLDKED